MLKIMKLCYKFINVIFIMFFVIFSNVTYANGNVVLEYNGNSQSFKYLNPENIEILGNLKDIMPGDRKEQIITIRAKNIKQETKMYLKMNNEGMEKLLENKISFRIYSGSNLVFDNAINKNNEEIINLYTFNKDDEFDMKIVIDVSEEIGNEIQDLALSIEWKFMVEENGQYVEIDIPQTSDNIMVYVWLVLLSLIGIVLVSIKRKKT